MPTPIPERVKRAIRADIKKQTMSCRDIARKHRVSVASVSRLAKDVFPDGNAFDRSKTKKITRASQADARALRAQLQLDLLHDAQRLRDRIWSPYTVAVVGRDGPEFIETKLPPLRDQQAGYVALAVCIDKSAALDTSEATDTEEMKGLLGGMLDQLVAKHGATAGARRTSPRPTEPRVPSTEPEQR